jgi:hypothetical protein
MHVHVRSGDAEAKVWVEPEVAIAASKGFNAKTLGDILDLVSARREDIKRAWHGHFGD